MYDRILFPVAGNDIEDVLFDHILDVAEVHNSTVYVLNVADTAQDSVTRIGEHVVDALAQEGEQIVEAMAERATGRKAAVVTDVRQGGVSETITEYAADYGIDLIAMPTHGRTGFERAFLGSTTERVVRHATVPVLTLRPDTDDIVYPYPNVLVPTDGSNCSEQALSGGIDVANTNEASVHLLTVIVAEHLGVDVLNGEPRTAVEERAAETIGAAKTHAEEAGVASVTTSIKSGPSVSRAILSYVDEHDIDLVVIGTHGRTGLDRYLLGSTTERIIRTSPVPVLAVRESAEET